MRTLRVFDYPLLILLVLCFLIWMWWKRRHPTFPPGPIGFPFLGSIPHLRNNPLRVLHNWSKQIYGPVMSVRFGVHEYVVLSTYDAIHETFEKQSSYFSSRPWNLVQCWEGQKGIVNSTYNDTYKLNRNLVMKSIKGFAFGELIVEKESHLLVQFLKSQTNLPCDVNSYTKQAANNVVCFLLFSKRREIQNQSVDVYADAPYGKLLWMTLMCDKLRNFPFFSGAVKRYKNYEKKTRKWIRNSIKEHQSTFDDDDKRDVLDTFLSEKTKRKNRNQTELTTKDLKNIFSGMVISSSDMISTTLSWMTLTLLHYPQYYDVINSEILNVIGDERPRYELQANMPFTCAFIQESFRRFPVAPLGMNHATTWPTRVGHYFIHGKAKVIANIWAINHDESQWPEPEKFDPYRHLDDNGNFIPSDRVVSFSLGPRRCLGEGIARVALFVFLVDLVKNFELSPEANDRLPSLDDWDFNVLLKPLPFKVVLKWKK